MTFTSQTVTGNPSISATVGPPLRLSLSLDIPLFTIIAKNYGAYTYQAVSLVSAKLSRLLPRSINGQFCLLDGHYRDTGGKPRRYEIRDTLRGSPRNSMWGVHRIPFGSQKYRVHYITVFGIFLTGAFLRYRAVILHFVSKKEEREKFEEYRRTFTSFLHNSLRSPFGL